jgi:hypothetical protein
MSLSFELIAEAFAAIPAVCTASVDILEDSSAFINP